MRNEPMWNTLRYALERRGILRPDQDRLTLHGRIHAAEDLPRTGIRSTVSVHLARNQGDSAHLETDGHFTLVLPLHLPVRLTILRPDHLPRMVEIRPLRTTLLFARGSVHSSCEIDLVLTSSLAAESGSVSPLLERITVPQDLRPVIVEWDHVTRPVHNSGFEPLFARIR
ncbi:MAG TPA: hypothetical protein PKE53_16385 [Flavobacteriales bacterium]|nr:hypothetical protein [Flavobacteriales bacterium]HNK85633.1 hypothetical protein [Flavobacteriales bacterium]HNO04460.1 hypothetical protein [Flavobacteriales bacterium]